jgi:hypothetical protein
MKKACWKAEEQIGRQVRNDATRLLCSGKTWRSVGRKQGRPWAGNGQTSRRKERKKKIEVKI